MKDSLLINKGSFNSWGNKAKMNRDAGLFWGYLAFHITIHFFTIHSYFLHEIPFTKVFPVKSE